MSDSRENQKHRSLVYAHERNQPPDYSPETLSDWESERREIFGERWGRVQEALSWLRTYGIYYYDAKIGNFTFGDEA
jgi:hypothetical protein